MAVPLKDWLMPFGVVSDAVDASITNRMKEMTKEAESEVKDMEKAAELSEVVELINVRIEKDAAMRALPVSLMLTESCMLTVKSSSRGYSKKAHTGGEEFKPVNCYVGKRGSIIYVFKPLAVADYQFMEMPESQACEALSGFVAWHKGVVDFELGRDVESAKAAAALEAERKNIERRSEVYGEDFASW